ncbi:hypothetical protein EL22_10910 [Halostagnicola sp. A56]|uniref:HalOD1 output domain-containing protein n=1 Tax=Halostagnicola sp. A56 TaxID=1495067 RepID=UPI0004A09988|nr:HalOD1 output domain-containing protein [Halostagnicola sp. A56]KDE60088.1 hypothetical protein EL22_10910 [Halostagnicola sp. A56]
MRSSNASLTVEIVATLESAGLSSDEYRLADEIDPEALERVVESADDSLEVRISVRGRTLVVTADGPRVESDGSRNGSDGSRGDRS